MLASLHIKNVALITEADIEFTNGLNILSGETGAGKSVILDSINFVLGAKADKSMIRHGEDFCMVTCVFNNLPAEVKALLAEFDVEDSEELIIKRKFDNHGNGYIKLNGENFTATMLRKITACLVDVHGQSEHFSLLSKSKQLECIDLGANTQDILTELNKSLTELNEVKNQLNSLGGNPEERARKIDLLQYQINEIEKAGLKEGEYSELIQQKNKILNAEKLSTSLGGALSALNDENGATDCILKAEQALKNISDIDDNFAQILDRLRLSREEITDISECINDNLYDLDFDPESIDEIENRLEIYHTFFRKYGRDLTEINNFYEKAVVERDYLLNFDKTSAKLIEKMQSESKNCYDICLKLSTARKKYANKFTKAVLGKLSELGMGKAQFEIAFGDFPKYDHLINYSSFGLDKVEFMFSANAGEPVKPLSKIISGGEMSRFMLALKTQLSTGLGTYVFDEIDAGISGLTASIVAKQFAQIAKDRQIIAISHLPQITCMSDRSLLISKFEQEEKTYTQVKVLTEEQKVQEIIRLIGGSDKDEIAIKHANNMVKDANDYKKSIND